MQSKSHVNNSDRLLIDWGLNFNLGLMLILFIACDLGFDDDLELQAFVFPVTSDLDRINAERMAELCRCAELEQLAKTWEIISKMRAH